MLSRRGAPLWAVEAKLTALGLGVRGARSPPPPPAPAQ